MSSFGEHLRRQRQMRGISLDEIVATTKISRRHLQALEDEQFEQLPGGIFNRSYVRGYALRVGLDEEQAVAEYQQAARGTAPDTRVIAQQHASLHSHGVPGAVRLPTRACSGPGCSSCRAGCGRRVYQDRQREKEQSASRASTAEVHPAPLNGVYFPDRGANSVVAAKLESRSPIAGESCSAGRGSVVAVDDCACTNSVIPHNSADETAVALPFELTVRPKDQAWVSIKADGGFVVRGIIGPPVVKTIHARTEIVF